MAAAKFGAGSGLAESAMGSTPHDRFERGELDVDGYLDALASQAVEIVKDKLPADRIAWLKGMLKEQLTSDPVLRERIRQATGRELEA